MVLEILTKKKHTYILMGDPNMAFEDGHNSIVH
jgi:hypothetical protein